MKNRLACALAILLPLASTHLSAQDHGAHQAHTGHQPPAAASPQAASPSTQAYQQASDRMHADMAIAYTGDADVDFMRGMIPHHQGAIDMAKVVLAHGKDPAVRELAQAVIAAQTAEIDMMRRWLAERGR